MFGPLLSTNNSPKGPNLKYLESLEFDLSGNRLSLAVPNGNWKQLPNLQGDIELQTNLYDDSQFNRFKKNDNDTSKIIFDRFYNYSTFMHPNLGTLHLIMQIVRIIKPNINLFSAEQLREEVKARVESICEESNKDQDDEFLLKQPSKNYQLESLGCEEFLTYQINHYSSFDPYYAIPLTSEHFITFGFHYSVNMKRDGEPPWYLMARNLEKQIMQSVKLELTETFQQEKEAANG
ncbi:hypothetical protein [Aliikangiella sp. G2MR2-5]|uniref:hypothetical protein n=1 Tax=Aliikangiella sp. G2MR2-5 TaxID=2788943 RepID=UPI0018ABA749|nr:hypothetical protein [Aliikangiella sp. G2MR2-5]